MKLLFCCYKIKISRLCFRLKFSVFCFATFRVVTGLTLHCTWVISAWCARTSENENQLTTFCHALDLTFFLQLATNSSYWGKGGVQLLCPPLQVIIQVLLNRKLLINSVPVPKHYKPLGWWNVLLNLTEDAPKERHIWKIFFTYTVYWLIKKNYIDNLPFQGF